MSISVTGSHIEGDLNISAVSAGLRGSYPPEGWVESLLRGPIIAAGLEELTDEIATDLEAERFQDAGRKLLQLAEQLKARGFDPVADLTRESAAEALVRGGDEQQGLLLAEKLLLSRAELFDHRGELFAHRLSEHLNPNEAWLLSANHALHKWPELGPEAEGPLLAAWERRRADGCGLKWAARAAEILSLVGRPGSVEQIRNEVELIHPFAQQNDPDRVLIELAFIETREKNEIIESKAWSQLLATADRPATDPAIAGRIWQRRGTILADADRLSDAKSAFTKAVEKYGRMERGGRAAADAFWAYEAAALASGEFSAAAEARSIAQELGRGVADSVRRRAQELEASGLRSYARQDLPEARLALWQSYALDRREGNLHRMHHALRQLGQIHADAGENRDAVRFFIACGHGKEARAHVAGVNGAEVFSALMLDGPSWERAASYAVLAAAIRRMPTDHIEEIAPALLTEADTEPLSVIAPQPGFWAKNAVAAGLFSFTDGQREQAIGRIRSDVRSPWVTVAKQAGLALSLSHNAGLSDEWELLSDVYLSDQNSLAQIPANALAAGWRDGAGRSGFLEAAKAGRVEALEVLVLAEADDPGLSATELTEQCTAAVLGAVNIETMTETREEGTITRQYSLGIHLEPFGILARRAQSDPLEQFVNFCLALASNDQDAVVNRISALNALYNAVPVISEAQLHRVFEDVVPIVAGQVQVSQVDEDARASQHRLSRYKIKLPEIDDLRAAALDLLSRADEAHDARLPALREITVACLSSRDSVIAAAGLRAADRLDIELGEHILTELSAVSDVILRHSIGRYVAKRWARFPAIWSLLARDDDHRVRFPLLDALLTGDEPEARTRLQEFAGDPDGYLRFLAHQALD